MKKKVFSLLATVVFTFSLMSMSPKKRDIFDDCYEEAVDFAVVLINIGGYTDEMFVRLTNMTYDLCIDEYFYVEPCCD